MKKKVLGFLLLGVFVLGLTGCGAGMKYPDLNDSAYAFHMGEYIDKSDDDAMYGTIEYNGRTYMPYGTLKHSLKRKDIRACIGYIVQDDNSSSVVDENDKDTRVYTLAEDADENYLMIYYIGTTFMNQPDFWRAVDTKNNEIDSPSYIESLDYGFWES